VRGTGKGQLSIGQFRTGSLRIGREETGPRGARHTGGYSRGGGPRKKRGAASALICGSTSVGSRLCRKRRRLKGVRIRAVQAQEVKNGLSSTQGQVAQRRETYLDASGFAGQKAWANRTIVKKKKADWEKTRFEKIAVTPTSRTNRTRPPPPGKGMMGSQQGGRSMRPAKM